MRKLSLFLITIIILALRKFDKICCVKKFEDQNWGKIYRTYETLINPRLRNGAAVSSQRYSYNAEEISFYFNETLIAGILFKPTANNHTKFPALTFLGPFGFVKEQSPVQYATRLAQLGFVTLIFDPRNHGESDGEPRRFECKDQKIQDLQAAVGFLQDLPYVNKKKLGAVGICQGASEVIEVASQDPRIKIVALVGGQYIDKDNLVSMVGGLSEFNRRMERGLRAKQRYKDSGELEYLRIVDHDRKDVALPHRRMWEWYHGWVPRSNWENYYTVMSDASLLRWDARSAAKNVTCPCIMIHSDNADSPNTARKFFTIMRSGDKKLKWLGPAMHTDFYDNPIVIDHAVDAIRDFVDELKRKNKF